MALGKCNRGLQTRANRVTTWDMAARSPAELYHAVSRRRARLVSALLAVRPKRSQHSFTVACTLVLGWRRDVPAAAHVPVAAPALSKPDGFKAMLDHPGGAS